MGGGLFPPQSSSSRAWAMKRRREEKGFPSSLWDPPDRIPNEPRARGGAKGPKPQGFLLLSFSCRCTLLLLLLRRRRPSADRRSAMKGNRERSERPISPFYLPLLLSRAQSLPRPAQAQASSDREQEDPVYFLRSIYSYRFYSIPATCGILALHVILHAAFCGFLFCLASPPFIFCPRNGCGFIPRGALGFADVIRPILSFCRRLSSMHSF